MKRRSRISVIVIISMIFINLSGCSIVDKAKIKLNLKNMDFEYFNENKVDKVVIQSSRDTGFRFMVTDKNTIKQVYDLLSSAKVVSGKADYDSDYVFEVYTGEKVKKFNYIVGAYDSDKGNFYDENKQYIVSKRLDNDIIQNLEISNRKPMNFKNVYYESILKVIDQNKDLLNKGGKSVGIDISGDVDVTQYQYSVDISDFMTNVNDLVPKATKVNKDREKYDIIISVRTYGFKTTKYKSIITIENKADKSQKITYVDCLNESSTWQINLLNKKPSSW